MFDGQTRVVAENGQRVLVELCRLNSIRIESPERYSSWTTVDPLVCVEGLGTGGRDCQFKPFGAVIVEIDPFSVF